MKELTGTITNYIIDGNKLTITIKNKEKILGTYYIKTKQEQKYLAQKIKVGDKIKVIGELKQPNKNTTKNLFNYQEYLKRKNIYFTMTISSYQKLSSTKNIYYIIKQKLIDRLNSHPYLYTFILGDKSYLSNEVIASYQENGISHLFAISGMHINLLSSMILFLLKKLKIKENNSYFLTMLFLLLYLWIVGFSPSIVRGVLFFILFSLNKIYYFYIKPLNIYILVVFITLMINPNFIFDVAFQYSFFISLSLLMFSSELQGNYLLSLWKTSLLSFLVSIPIALFHFYQINILSILYNLFFVPLISILIFPITLLSVIFPFLIPLLNIVTEILETTSLFLSKVSFLKLIFPKLHPIIYIIYFLILVCYLKYKKKKWLIILIILLCIHYLYPVYQSQDYLKMIDVGQGDSILLHSKNESILIDTGGIPSYQKDWQISRKKTSIVKTTTIPLLKSLGIKKIKTLILTHGDYDHIGEAKILLENFKVEEVLINPGKMNDLEKNLIDENYNIRKIKSTEVLSCGNIDLIQLNKTFSNENDSSTVLYAKYQERSILLTGDASIKSENYILNNYELGNIDILKVGHHGSKTSTSDKLLQVTKPKLALISCGLDNKFSHPHKETIEKLEKYNINYLTTSQEGTITIDLNTLKIT